MNTCRMTYSDNKVISYKCIGRDAHERENLVRTNPEQMKTGSNGEERRRT